MFVVNDKNEQKKYSTLQKLYMRIIKDNPNLLAMFLTFKKHMADEVAINYTIDTIMPSGHRGVFLNTLLIHPLAEKYVGRRLKIKLFGSSKNDTINFICRGIRLYNGYFIINGNEKYSPGIDPYRIVEIDGKSFYPRLYIRMFQQYRNAKSLDDIYEGSKLVTNNFSLKHLSTILPSVVYPTPFVERSMWRYLCFENNNIRNIREINHG